MTKLTQRWQQVSQYLADGRDTLLAVETALQQKDNCGNWLSWLLPSLLGLLFVLQNPLLYGMAPAYDASLFATMGKMWADGGVLYRDMIDIKGPVIFLLDAIGYAAGGFQGIWLLETILLIWGLNALYRTLALWGVAPLSRLAGMLAWLCLYAYRYYYGNMTEDYTFCLGLIAQYYFVRMLLAVHFRWQDALIPAFTFGLIAMLRMNNAAMWCGYYFALFVYWLWQRRWQDAVKLTISGIVGLMIVVLPLLAYFIWHGVLKDFWFYSFGIFFGNSYGNGHSLMVGFLGLARTGLLLLLPVLIALVWQQRTESGTQRPWGALVATQLAGIIMGIVANSVSGHTYEHYEILFFTSAILILPMVIQVARSGGMAGQIGHQRMQQAGIVTLLLLVGYILAQHIIFTWSRFESPIPKLSHELTVSLAASIIVTMVVVGGWLMSRGRQLYLPAMSLLVVLSVLMLVLPLERGLIKGRPFDDVSAQMVNYIKANSSYNDLIWVDGVVPQYYVWTERRPASSYLFFDNVTPPYDVRTRMVDDLKRNKPKFIIVKLTRMETVMGGKDKDSTPSFINYYRYITEAYQPVSADLPRLYQLKP
ncbi:hypothetical protein [Tolumonas lignilytica]|uniref:hypothetical protein n=1 Tax=Tolumonas lignilytica TaxID=1283284 RepID=UPI0004657D68|nr:hypothetical protein [Tolumonas lignilytica]